LKLLLATHNEHKRREFARLLEGDGAVEVEALSADVLLPPEEGQTFAENALGKARAAAASGGCASIADDSGIEAAALAGAPGVRSARYAGEGASDLQNLQKLLREAPAGSRLEYVCVIAYVDPGRGVERVFEGRCGGSLAAEPRGARGFGYDPAFLPEDGPEGQTMAELSDAQKDAISHRGRAARALLGWLLEDVDRGGGGDREAESGVPGVAREQQQGGGEQRDHHGDAPGDPGHVHPRAFWRMPMSAFAVSVEAMVSPRMRRAR
jgi:XTP/dITP diphosphohydrolase